LQMDQPVLRNGPWNPAFHETVGLADVGHGDGGKSEAACVVPRGEPGLKGHVPTVPDPRSQAHVAMLDS
jgi:hypothetical protein